MLPARVARYKVHMCTLYLPMVIVASVRFFLVGVVGFAVKVNLHGPGATVRTFFSSFWHAAAFRHFSLA